MEKVSNQKSIHKSDRVNSIIKIVWWRNGRSWNLISVIIFIMKNRPHMRIFPYYLITRNEPSVIINRFPTTFHQVTVYILDSKLSDITSCYSEHAKFSNNPWGCWYSVISLLTCEVLAWRRRNNNWSIKVNNNAFIPMSR